MKFLTALKYYNLTLITITLIFGSYCYYKVLSDPFSSKKLLQNLNEYESTIYYTSNYPNNELSANESHRRRSVNNREIDDTESEDRYLSGSVDSKTMSSEDFHPFSQSQDAFVNQPENLDPGKTEELAYKELKVDYKRPHHVLWPKDENCSSLVVRFGVGIDGALLHSFPRSGNTWLRYLLEGATGIFTSSFYTDRTLIREGYLGERDGFLKRSTIATKLHFIKHLKRYPSAPCITIIRNPARLFISLWSFVNIKNRRQKHTATVSEASLKTKAFHTFIQGKLKKWLKTYVFALTNRKDIYPMSYELIREDPIGETRRLLQYLNVKPDERRLACLSRHITGKVKAGQRQINPYTLEEEEQMKDAMQTINEYLVKRGFQPLPDYDKYK